MSRNDYTKYSKDSKVETPEVEAVTPVTETPAVEPKTEPTPVVETKPTYAVGYVTGCTKLNVRNSPRSTAGIICELACDTEVEINEQESNNDFYKIYTSSGIEGYCMKSYITQFVKK